MSNKEDVAKDLKRHRREYDNKCIKDVIVDTINPFSQNLDATSLYNLGTGKRAKEETEHFLLHFMDIGNDAREAFINECFLDPERFEKHIKGQKIHTSATESKLKKIIGKYEKLISVCMMRDLFETALVLALDNKMDMLEVFTYPLTPVPLSLCHVSGFFHQTPKVTLLK